MRSVGLAAMALMAGPPAPTPPPPPPQKPSPATVEPEPCDKLKPLRPANPNPAQRHLPGLF